ncbi:sulfite exporter TauE/SafE family protein [Ideonella margarita]|uniref:Probable membrane transporter protein n=1 Tax=Ideonella margarita TaxID=2984191 RepID=A0ABU9C6V2_9BURK
MDLLLEAGVLGLLVGSVMALTGAGGGVLAAPLLMLVLHLSPSEATPIALVAVGAAAWLGAWLGWRERVLRYRAAALIGGIAAVTAPLGVWLSHQVPGQWLKAALVAVLGWTCLRMARMAWQRTPPDTRELAYRPCQFNPEKGQLHWTAPCARALAGTGASAGLLSGLLGVGGGFIIVPALSRHSTLDVRHITATSLAVTAVATLSGWLSALHFGSVNVPVALCFGGAAMAAMLLGQRFAAQLPARWVQTGLAVLAGGLGVRLLVNLLMP